MKGYSHTITCMRCDAPARYWVQVDAPSGTVKLKMKMSVCERCVKEGEDTYPLYNE